MNAPECGDQKDTGFGFSAWCWLPPGHTDLQTEHESADFWWTDGQDTATLKVMP